MSFASDLAKFRLKTNRSADSVVNAVTVLLAQGVVQKSAVDTGRFRANWVFGVGAIDESVNDDTDKSGQPTLTKLTAAINRTGSGKVTFISNSLPYAVRLENGWSRQSPQGMVALTIREFDDYVRQATMQVNK